MSNTVAAKVRIEELHKELMNERHASPDSSVVAPDTLLLAENGTPSGFSMYGLGLAPKPSTCRINHRVLLSSESRWLCHRGTLRVHPLKTAVELIFLLLQRNADGLPKPCSSKRLSPAIAIAEASSRS